MRRWAMEKNGVRVTRGWDDEVRSQKFVEPPALYCVASTSVDLKVRFLLFPSFVLWLTSPDCSVRDVGGVVEESAFGIGDAAADSSSGTLAFDRASSLVTFSSSHKPNR